MQTHTWALLTLFLSFTSLSKRNKDYNLFVESISLDMLVSKFLYLCLINFFMFSTCSSCRLEEVKMLFGFSFSIAKTSRLKFQLFPHTTAIILSCFLSKHSCPQALSMCLLLSFLNFIFICKFRDFPSKKIDIPRLLPDGTSEADGCHLGFVRLAMRLEINFNYFMFSKHDTRYQLTLFKQHVRETHRRK